MSESRRADFLCLMIGKVKDTDKVRFIRELSSIGKLSHLRGLFPLGKYGTPMLRVLARRCAEIIIERELPGLFDDRMEALADLLDANMDAWQKQDLRESPFLRNIAAGLDEMHIPETGRENGSGGYRLLELGRIRPGMKVYLPVVDSEGKVVVERGAELTIQILLYLRKNGLEHVAVSTAVAEEPDPGPAAESAAEAPADPLAVEMARRFNGQLGDPVMKTIHDAALACVRAAAGENAAESTSEDG